MVICILNRVYILLETSVLPLRKPVKLIFIHREIKCETVLIFGLVGWNLKSENRYTCVVSVFQLYNRSHRNNLSCKHIEIVLSRVYKFIFT